MQFLTRIYNNILPQTSAFLGVFFVVMVIGYGVLSVIDFVPEPVAEPEENTESTNVTNNNDFNVDLDQAFGTDYTSDEAVPIAISIDALDRNSTILNPTSNSVEALDNALLKGVVRHPDSGDLTGPGNILLLGHSSYLKNVFNRNYQAFNGIQELSWGDTITLESADMAYIYQVDRVYKAAASNVEVPTGGSEYKLTLVTCNVFAAKEDRFIVEATLISKKPL